MIRKIIKTETEKSKILNFMHLTKLFMAVILTAPITLKNE